MNSLICSIPSEVLENNFTSFRDLNCFLQNFPHQEAFRKNHPFGLLGCTAAKREKWFQGAFLLLILNNEDQEEELRTLTTQGRQLYDAFREEFTKATGLPIAPICRWEGLLWVVKVDNLSKLCQIPQQIVQHMKALCIGDWVMNDDTTGLPEIEEGETASDVAGVLEDLHLQGEEAQTLLEQFSSELKDRDENLRTQIREVQAILGDFLLWLENKIYFFVQTGLYASNKIQDSGK